MKEFHTIDTVEALRAISDPLRLRVLEALRDSAKTSSQVARLLGEKPTKLHYHVVEMERCGLIEVTETSIKGNLLEKYYAPVAANFRVDNSLFERSPGPEAMEVFYSNVVSKLDHTAAHLRAAIQAGRVSERDAAASLQVLLHAKLSRDDAAQFKERLKALLAEFGPRSRDDCAEEIALTLVFYTQGPQQEGDEIREGGKE